MVTLACGPIPLYQDIVSCRLDVGSLLCVTCAVYSVKVMHVGYVSIPTG